MTPLGLDAEIRTLAERACRAGARVAREVFGRVHAVELKPDHTEVTAIDRAAQAAIIEEIERARPADCIVAEEEFSRPPHGAELTWVIDPIDGTRNFVRGIPFFASAVACVRAGWPLVGAICDPLTDRVYSAQAVVHPGGELRGALFIDGQPARPPVGDERRLSRPIVAIPSVNPRIRTTATELVQDWMSRFIIRDFGSSAQHTVMVALGQLDAAICSGHLWDVAAGWPMVVAAGGDMLRPDGRRLFPLDDQPDWRSSMIAVVLRAAVARREFLPDSGE